MKVVYIAAFALLVTACGSEGNNNSNEKEEGKEVKDSAMNKDERQHHHNHANEHMHSHDIDELIARFESEEREKWQKPSDVIALFGDLNGKKVLDIGAGSGYFSFRLAEKGAQVIAADVNDEFQAYIQDRKKELELSDEQLELRKIPYDDPGVNEGEIDHAIIVNTYHHIDNRSEYFGKLLKGLKDGGSLMVVDYKKEETPHGPPVEMKMKPETVMNELRAAGYHPGIMDLDTTLLDYQYIIIAYKQ